MLLCNLLKKLQKQDERHLPQFLPLAMQFLKKMQNFMWSDFQLSFPKNGNQATRKQSGLFELDYKSAFSDMLVCALEGAEQNG